MYTRQLLCRALRIPKAVRHYTIDPTVEAQLSRLEETNTLLSQELAKVRERAEYLEVMEEMRYYSERPQKPISLSVFQRFATHGMKKAALLEGAQFLKAELPVRLAQQAHLPDHLPRGLAGLMAFQKVRETFTLSFAELRAFQFSQPIPNWDDEVRFHKVLHVIQTRHKRVPELIFEGCRQLTAQLQRNYGANWAEHPDRQLTQSVLEDFFAARVGVRFLIGQQIRLHRQYVDGQTPENIFGLVHLKVRPRQLMQDSIETAERMAIASFGACPEIILHCASDEPFVQIAYHIQFITVRLLRHAIMGVLKAHGTEKVKARKAPPVVVTVTDGPANEDLCIWVQESGLGVPRSKMRHLWSYLHDDGRLGEQEWKAVTEEDMKYGESFGLPLARLRARLFGGDVVAQNMEGQGLHMYAYIRKFTENAMLPESFYQTEQEETTA